MKTLSTKAKSSIFRTGVIGRRFKILILEVDCTSKIAKKVTHSLSKSMFNMGQLGSCRMYRRKSINAPFRGHLWAILSHCSFEKSGKRSKRWGNNRVTTVVPTKTLPAVKNSYETKNLCACRKDQISTKAIKALGAISCALIMLITLFTILCCKTSKN